MDIANTTPYQVAYNMGILKSGRSCIVVVAKATYDLVKHESPRLAEEQYELSDTDVFSGEPGYSAPLYENDFATYKPRCDVILHRPIAFAPKGIAVEKVEVGLQFGEINKRFMVVGERVWQKSGYFAEPSKPILFNVQSINWETAYGGSDNSVYEEAELSETYLENPIGIGYWHNPKVAEVEGHKIAQTESVEQPITDPLERHKPEGFGVVGRNWQPRSSYGGTYDEDWMENQKPFLPQDFNELYYQSAPEDQQIDYPRGGEIVALTNLSPLGKLEFQMPELDDAPVLIVLQNGEEIAIESAIDTVTIDPILNKLIVVQRGHYPLKNNIHEVNSIVVGEPVEESLWEDEMSEEEKQDTSKLGDNIADQLIVDSVEASIKTGV